MITFLSVLWKLNICVPTESWWGDWCYYLFLSSIYSLYYPYSYHFGEFQLYIPRLSFCMKEKRFWIFFSIFYNLTFSVAQYLCRAPILHVLPWFTTMISSCAILFTAVLWILKCSAAKITASFPGSTISCGRKLKIVRTLRRRILEGINSQCAVLEKKESLPPKPRAPTFQKRWASGNWRRLEKS